MSWAEEWKAWELTGWDEAHNPYLVKWTRPADESLVFTQEQQFALDVLYQNAPADLREELLGGHSRSQLRTQLIKEYSFAIPCEAALRLIAACSPAGVIELGAGTGYWALMLRTMGVEVQAFDVFGSGGYSLDIGKHSEVRRWDNPAKYFRRLPAGEPWPTLLMVWPSLNHPWAYDALQRYRGDTVVYVGEGFGGCTADDLFHQELDRAWEDTEDSIAIPQWHAIHDYCWIYRRKRGV